MGRCSWQKPLQPDLDQRRHLQNKVTAGSTALSSLLHIASRNSWEEGKECQSSPSGRPWHQPRNSYGSLPCAWLFLIPKCPPVSRHCIVQTKSGRNPVWQLDPSSNTSFLAGQQEKEEYQCFGQAVIERSSWASKMASVLWMLQEVPRWSMSNLIGETHLQWNLRQLAKCLWAILHQKTRG